MQAQTEEIVIHHAQHATWTETEAVVHVILTVAMVGAHVIMTVMAAVHVIWIEDHVTLIVTVAGHVIWIVIDHVISIEMAVADHVISTEMAAVHVIWIVIDVIVVLGDEVAVDGMMVEMAVVKPVGEGMMDQGIKQKVRCFYLPEMLA